MLRVYKLMGVGTMLAFAVGNTHRAWAVDLTGIWLGEQQCDRYNGKKFNTPYKNDVMVISQNGADVNMAALFDPQSQSFALLYQGHVIDDAKDGDRKGQAAFTECTTAPGSPYQEVLRATKAELKGKGDGDFEGDSIFLQIDDVTFPTDTGTCHWTYKRVDTSDVGVPDCSVGMPTAPTKSSSPKRP